MEKISQNKGHKETEKTDIEEIDYRKMYLEQRITALRMETQVLQYRFSQIQQELKVVGQELQEHTRHEEDKNGNSTRKSGVSDSDKKRSS